MQDFYEARNSIYCYEDTNILKNKLDLKNNADLAKYEAKITAAKLLILRKKRITGNFDINHFVRNTSLFIWRYLSICRIISCRKHCKRQF